MLTPHPVLQTHDLPSMSRRPFASSCVDGLLFCTITPHPGLQTHDLPLHVEAPISIELLGDEAPDSGPTAKCIPWKRHPPTVVGIIPKKEMSERPPVPPAPVWPAGVPASAKEHIMKLAKGSSSSSADPSR